MILLILIRSSCRDPRWLGLLTHNAIGFSNLVESADVEIKDEDEKQHSVSEIQNPTDHSATLGVSVHPDESGIVVIEIATIKDISDLV